ncbi:MAG: 4-hydroxythreonine-4-phosphate dehydrogenase PdxA [Gammaproteobacteria bacterium]
MTIAPDTRDALPRVVVSTGDPAGIGPDVVLSVAKSPWPARLVAFADAQMLQARSDLLGTNVNITPVDDLDQVTEHRAGQLHVIHIATDAPVTPGELNTDNARYVLRVLDRCADACRSGAAAAMVTAPLHKGVINDAGMPFSGHTEYLAERTGAPLPVMMLCAGKLRVALATTHLPLRAVPDAITPAGLEQVLRVLHADLRTRFALDKPVIGVCGLNPHAGEGGHLGHEDDAIIAPVLDRLRQEQFELIGPLPADTAFTPRVLDTVDAVLAMYHDQGLPVLKYAGFGDAINITLGLPIVRTSVDHGTALDLAGSGRADDGSLRAALALAIDIAA